MNQFSLPLAALFSAALLGFSIPAVSQADSVTQGSAGSVGASQSVFGASGDVLQASGEFIVVSATAAAEGSIIVIEAVATGVSHTLKFATDVLKGSALAIGTGITASITTAGTILSSDGEVIAFLPNDDGERLLHASSYGD